MVTNGGSTPGSKGDGGGFVLLAEPASLPSLISSFFTQNKGGGGGVAGTFSQYIDYLIIGNNNALC